MRASLRDWRVGEGGEVENKVLRCFFGVEGQDEVNHRIIGAVVWLSTGRSVAARAGVWLCEREGVCWGG